MSADSLPKTAAELLEYLPAIAEDSYREFSAKLVPGVENMLGIRIPLLRRIAKALAKGDFRAFLSQSGNTWFEETMIRGMVIGYARMDLAERLEYIRGFVPDITNWSVCDSFCAGLTAVREDPDRVKRFLLPYLDSDREYEARFGAVMLMDHFTSGSDLPWILEKLRRCPARDYYARMGIAWAISACFAHFPERVMGFLESEELDPDTLYKTQRKILESNRVSAAWKQKIRAAKPKVSKG